jgi:hypothetical protein
MLDDLTPEGITFLQAWQQAYPETPPITYQFKRHLPKRWVRIYSLPDGKRYANDKPEWDALLARQNAVIDYLVPQGQQVQIVFNLLDRDNHLFKSVNLTRLGMVRDADFETGFETWLLEDVWHSGQFDPSLAMIADEQMRAFIMAPDCIISPYDGGMDIILKDPHTAHAFKRAFPDWISPREDGL